MYTSLVKIVSEVKIGYVSIRIQHSTLNTSQVHNKKYIGILIQWEIIVRIIYIFKDQINYSADYINLLFILFIEAAS